MSDGNLVSAKQQAVLLEAQGLSRDEIAKLGIASTATVSRWRKDPEYKKAVEEMRAKTVTALEPLFNKVKADLVAAAVKSIATLLEAQQAMNEDGDPDHPTRIKAAIGILDKLRAAGFGESVDDRASGSSSSAAVIVIREDGGSETSVPESEPAESAITLDDAEVEDVTP